VGLAKRLVDWTGGGEWTEKRRRERRPLILKVEVEFRDLAGTVEAGGFTWDEGRTDIYQITDIEDPDNSPREFIDSVPITPEAPFEFDFDMESGVGYPGVTTAIGELSGALEVLGFPADVNVPDFTATFVPVPEPGSALLGSAALAALLVVARTRGAKFGPIGG